MITESPYWTHQLNNTPSTPKNISFLINPNNSNYILYTSFGDTNNIHLTKFNSEGQTIFTINNPLFHNNPSLKPHIISDSHDNIYITYKSYDIKKYTYIIVLIKLDPLGNFKWVKNYPTQNIIDQLITIGQSNTPLIYTKSLSNTNTLNVSTYQIDETETLIQFNNTNIISPSFKIYNQNVITATNDQHGLTISKTDKIGTCIWTYIIENQTNNNHTNILIDTKENTYIIFINNNILIIYKLNPKGGYEWDNQYQINEIDNVIINPNHSFWNENNIITSLDQDNNINITYICTNKILHYIKVGHNGSYLENYHESINNDYVSLFTDTYNRQHLISINNDSLSCFKLQPKLYLSTDTYVLLEGNVQKPIQEIKIGDIVSTGHTVTNVCCMQITDQKLLLFEENCLDHRPNRNLITSSDCPIFYGNDWKKADSFDHCAGVKYINIGQEDELYSLQLDQGTYIANGIEVLSIP